MKSRIRELREAKGWSLGDLSYEARISVQALRNLEDGTSGPRLSTAQKLAKALGVSLTDLFEDGAA